MPPALRKTALRLALFPLLLAGPPAAAVDCPARAGDRAAWLQRYLETAWEEGLARSPEAQTYLGRKTGLDSWTERTDRFALESAVIARRRLVCLDARLSGAELPEREAISLRLFRDELQSVIAGVLFRDQSYAVSSMGLFPESALTLLATVQPVTSRAEAEAFIERVRRVGTPVDEIIALARARAALGVLPPDLVYPRARATMAAILASAPFSAGGPPNPAATAFAQKVDALDLPAEDRAALKAGLAEAMAGPMKTAFERFAGLVDELDARQDADRGVWALPNGAAYYRYRIEDITTLPASPDEVHAYGLAEVARLEAALAAIQAEMGVRGSLQDFFRHMRTEARFFYPDTEEGRAAFLEEVRARIAAIEEAAPAFFSLLPEAPLDVRAVEPFREETVGKAFYQPPPELPGRPAYYYANLKDMADWPRWSIGPITYHEAVPGHHFQIAIAQELEGLPRFRRFGGHGAYVEGWALYAETLAGAMGGYPTPEDRFGQLTTELWRAARLVVDTGIHALRWSREEAIDYMAAHTVLSRADATDEIDRYFVMPAQALGYKLGMRSFESLRARAEAALGPRFDRRAFHTELLRHGSLPLPVLEEVIADWIEAQASD